MSRTFHKFFASSTISSTYSFGVIPFSLAFFSIFSPCSSVPVKKKTSYPTSLLYLAIASAIGIDYDTNINSIPRNKFPIMKDLYELKLTGSGSNDNKNKYHYYGINQYYNV